MYGKLNLPAASHEKTHGIDLFSWETRLDAVKIRDQIEQMKFKKIRIVNLSKTQLDYIINGVKVTFFANGWPELQNRKLLTNNLYIADLKTLAIMKINTLFIMAKYRDYYDLYTLNKTNFPLPELYQMALMKINNLSKTLFQKALIYTDDIDDEKIEHLSPKEKISLKEMEKHFSKEIKKWNKLLDPQ